MWPDPATVAGATDGEGNCPLLLYFIITDSVLDIGRQLVTTLLERFNQRFYTL